MAGVVTMSGSDPIGRDLTRDRARRRLAAGAACALCGEADPEVIANRPANLVPASVLEVHHVGGRVNDPDLTVVLCLNCHRRLSTRMPAYGVVLQPSGARLDSGADGLTAAGPGRVVRAARRIMHGVGPMSLRSPSGLMMSVAGGRD